MGGQLSGNDLGHGYEQFEQLVSLPSDINQFPKDESAFNGIDDGSSMQDIQAPYYSDFRNPFHEAYQSLNDSPSAAASNFSLPEDFPA